MKIRENMPKVFFLLVERGDCYFVTKASNAEIIGASMLIVYDNKDVEPEGFSM